MREILFRGKSIQNSVGDNVHIGDFVYGYLDKICTNNGTRFVINIGAGKQCFIPIFVDENTVGQYTGLTDKNGKKIFEGDIVKARPSLSESPYLVSFVDGGFQIKNKYGNVITPTQEYIDKFDTEIIGNIYDNPELYK